MVMVPVGWLGGFAPAGKNQVKDDPGRGDPQWINCVRTKKVAAKGWSAPCNALWGGILFLDLECMCLWRFFDIIVQHLFFLYVAVWLFWFCCVVSFSSFMLQSKFGVLLMVCCLLVRALCAKLGRTVCLGAAPPTITTTTAANHARPMRFQGSFPATQRHGWAAPRIQ